MLDETQAKQLTQEVIRRCQGQPVEVVISAQDSRLTRFANNAIHQNVAESDLVLRVRRVIGKRIGIASTNRTDGNALDEALHHAQANAQASPEDPDYPGLAGPAEYQVAKAFDPVTSSYSPEGRAQQVGEVCRLAKESDLNASGAFSTGSAILSVANSEGLFAFHPYTKADFQTVIMGEDSSGRAQSSSWQVGDIPVVDLGREAIQKAQRGRHPQRVEPGRYTVIFDPYVTEDLLHMLNLYGMSAQAVLEGRSWMNDRQGKRAMSQLVSIWDDGLDPQGIPMPFDFEGVPKVRVDIIKEGVVDEPVYDRYTAHKAGKTTSGHAIPPSMRNYGPLATNLFMAPGTAELEEMIRSTEHGLYITRFWYTRLVHPRDCVVTGMTRDGVFMIENGELTRPVKNLRFTQSYVQALAQVEAISKETRLLFSQYGNMALRVPALKIKDFNFTGSTV